MGILDLMNADSTNWASKDRPQANKLKVANYDHSLNGLLQEVADELTRQGVLGDPQEMGVTVQTVCPAFLQRTAPRPLPRPPP